MASLSLFPKFMDPLAGVSGGGGGGDGLMVTLLAEPDVTLEKDVTVSVEDAPVEVVVEADIEIEVE